MDKIRVIYKAPNEPIKDIDIENSLEAFQEAIGGYIETVTVAEDLVIICNEEGRLKNMPFNCEILGVGFVGPILFVGVKGDEFCSLPEKARKILKEIV